MMLPLRVKEASKEKIVEVSQKVLLDTLNDIKVQLDDMDNKSSVKSLGYIEDKISIIRELISNHEHIDLEFMIDNELRISKEQE